MDRKLPEGMLPAAVAALGLMGLMGCMLGLATAFAVKSCIPDAPAPQSPPVPPIVQQATASAQARTVATQSIRVTITRRKGSVASVEAQGGPSNPSRVQGDLPQPNTPCRPAEEPYEETISIDAVQSVVSEATASAESVVKPLDTPVYFPIGGMVATVPGFLAVTYRVLDLPAGLGIDLEGNPLQVGAGVTLGDKVFLMGGGYVSFALQPGVFVGVGCRF